MQSIYEIRLRYKCPICVCVCGKYELLKDLSNGKTLYADKRLIDYVVLRATENSLYSYNNELKQAFITAKGGIRLGICGEVVYDENQKVKTIKNLSSLVLRVPHEVPNCSRPISACLINRTTQRVNNLLIISPPGCGKTTFIRDIARQLSLMKRIYNILIVDERYELSASVCGENTLDVGLTSDCLVGTTKSFAFGEGVRALKPDVIVCDELMDLDDADAVSFAVNSGVSVVATVHGDDIASVKRKEFMQGLIRSRTFDYYVILSLSSGAGTIEDVLDADFNSIYSEGGEGL